MYYLKRLAVFNLIKFVESFFERVSDFNETCDVYYNRTIRNPYCLFIIVFMISLTAISFLAKYDLI